MRSHGRALAAAGCTLLALAAGIGAATAKSHKVIAAPGQLDPATPGVSLWHDYGAFGLYRVSDEALRGLSGEARARLRIDPEMDAILFDRHPISTTAVRDVPPTLAAKSPAGPALHLVQFVGPIKQAWLDEVEATGARLVQYVATNGYMVWSDAASRGKLDGLAADGDFLQFSGSFQPAYKLGGSIERRILEATRPDELVPVVVQMYSHTGKSATQQAVANLAVEVQADWSPILAFENTLITVRAADLLTIAALPDVVWVGERFPRHKMDEVQGQILAGDFNAGNTGPAAPGYLAWLDSLGFSQNPADYPLVNVTDDGVGNGTIVNGAGDSTLTRFRDGVTSRIVYANNCTTDALADGRGGHGHINTSIISGYDQRAGLPFTDANGYLRGQGINPYGRTGNTKIFRNAGAYDVSVCGNTDTGVIKSEQDKGAVISSNSWGCSGCAGSYDDSSQAYDVGVRDADLAESGNQQMIYLFAAGNSGSGAGTVGTPGNGKNMITVGASENQRPNDEGGGWTDGCGVGATGADNAMDVINFSSRGPAPGSRVKPEIIAPGTHIQGTASNATGYAGDSVCDQYRPPGQTVFAASSGTSHSTPAAAGVASLYYRWMQTEYGLSTPSPAMMKAYMVAHPTYLTGVSGNGNLPTNSQGYGMPNMQLAFDDAPRALLDQTQIFGATGETWTWNGAVADPGKPVRIVMTYTDAAGAIGTSPQVNNLDLQATVGGSSYLGNAFSGQWSTTGGTADNKNNYEAIFLPAGASGAISITVTAANVAGDGVPNNATPTDQDFALVCYNCAQNPDFTQQVTPTSLSVCAPTAADYTVNIGSILGYTAPVTLAVSGNPAGTTASFSANPVTPVGTSTLSIGNTGAAAAGSYTLDVTGDAGSGPKTTSVGLNLFSAVPSAGTLTSPSNGALNVPALPTFSWSAVAQAAGYDIEVATDAAFSNVVASASGVSGTSWTPGTALNTSSTYYWRVRAGNTCGSGGWSSASSFTTVAAPGDCGPGTVANVLVTETFEGGLGGWTTPAGTGANTWAISTANPNAGAQHVRGVNTGSITDQRLVSPPVSLPTGENPVVLKFDHVPNLENNGTAGCYDGGILEVSSNGGSSWTQVPNANLLVGPYVGAISGSFSNPLAGLQAWCSATTTTYRQTIADVSSYAGQTVQFRWRIGTDSSVSRPGWDVDNVSVQSCQASGGIPNANVSPASLSSTQAPDAVTTQTLDVGNTGTADLHWSIAEENAPRLPRMPAFVPSAQPASEVVGADAPAAAATGRLATGAWLAPLATLHDNGPLVTNPGGGAGGADVSALQLTNTSLGSNVSQAGPFRLADDFTVPAGGWTIDTLTFFAYQTGSTTASTITGVNLRIWDGVPGAAGSNIVFGDDSSNRLASTAFTNVYRTSGTDLGNTQRPVMAVVATVGTSLAAGTYWVDWQLSGSLASGPWAPAVTLVGQTNAPGANAMQYVGSSSTWQAAMDTGSSTQQDFPFVVEGTAGGVTPPACSAPSDIPWLTVSPASGTTIAGGSSAVTVTFDATGLAVGSYAGNLCVTSNDPDAGPGNGTALVVVPVSLTVDAPLPPEIFSDGFE